MKVLALDSATSACSAALWQDGTIVAQRFVEMERGQSEVLVPMVAEIMAEAGAVFADVDLLAVTVGPGAFTGIRIGLATARALALASAKPLAGIATPEAVAAAIPAAERAGRTILVALDSRRDEVWVQAFTADLAPLTDPTALLPLEAATLLSGPVVVVGDAASLVAPLMTNAVMATSLGAPHAAQVAALAARRWAEGTALPPEPLYLRPADVTMPK